MGISYPVGPGTILRCDYSRGGFQPPEMVKARPAVVISPRLPHRAGLCFRDVTVAPEKADELVTLLDKATADVMSRQPGFVSANIRRSLDGKHVTNSGRASCR